MTSTYDDNRPDTARRDIGAGDPGRTDARRDPYRAEGYRDEYKRRREEYRHSEFRDDIHKDPNELEREADRARADVEHTLEALERRLSPGELLDQVLRMVKDNSGAFGRNLATQVRNNPLPVLLTGVGMTWLMTASDRPPRRSVSKSSMAPSMGERAASMGSTLSSSASSAAESARGAVSRAGESARSAAEQARDAVHDVTDSAREGARHARDSAADMMHGLADSTRSGAEALWDSYDYLKREQPLVLGALAVAAGALIGSLLPGTRTEDRLMGQYSEDATERLKEEARQRGDEARAAAAEAAEAARDAVQPKRADRTGSKDEPGSAARS